MKKIKIERLSLDKFDAQSIGLCTLMGIKGGSGCSNLDHPDITNKTSTSYDEVVEMFAEDGTLCYRSVTYKTIR